MTKRRALPTLRQLLLVAALLSATATAVAVAQPADATNEYYECGSCAEVNGPNNYVRNNFGINHSGKGACSAIWRSNGGSNYTLLADECRGGGETSHDCLGSEVYGHGEVESESGNGYLRGRQDNFAKCE